MRWLLVKDLQILRRSPFLLALLVIYPILLAAIVGFSLTSGPSKPRVAFLNEIAPDAALGPIAAVKRRGPVRCAMCPLGTCLSAAAANGITNIAKV